MDSAASTWQQSEVVERCGSLWIYGIGSIMSYSNKPIYSIFVNDDGSVLWKDLLFNATHNLYLRLYKPASSSSSAKLLPILYFIHGGGFCYGSRTWPHYQNYCFKLALELQAVIISPDYRLAPKHRLPAAITDCFMALEWLHSHVLSEEPDTWLTDVADFNNVFITGDSAGGNIAHHLAMKLGAGSPQLAPVQVRGYVLLEPFFGGTVLTKSEVEGPKDAFLNLETIEW